MEDCRINKLEDIDAYVASLKASIQSQSPHEFSYISPVLFRGQSDVNWTLRTTLERYIGDNYSTDAYLRYILKALPAIESFIGRQFELRWDNEEDSRQFLSDYKLKKGQDAFMLYLRHHGFPSPLLDWTRSLYVAMYFACCDLNTEKDAALYLFVENAGFGKGGMVGAPEIGTLGHYISSHRRHFTQQSEYSLCVAKGEHGHWYYHPHEEVFRRSGGTQDLLQKLTIPGQLKPIIMQKLDSMNINAFSLFQTEEALMQMLAFRERDDLQ